MGIVIDLIVIFFVLSSIFYGYKKGLAKVGLRMLGFLIGILIAFVLYKPISMMIIENTTSVNDAIKSKIILEIINNMNITDIYIKLYDSGFANPDNISF